MAEKDTESSSRIRNGSRKMRLSAFGFSATFPSRGTRTCRKPPGAVTLARRSYMIGGANPEKAAAFFATHKTGNVG